MRGTVTQRGGVLHEVCTETGGYVQHSMRCMTQGFAAKARVYMMGHGRTLPYLP